VGQRGPAAGRHQQKDQPRNLKPQLVQNLPKSSSRSRHRARHGAHGPAALYLLAGDPRYYP